MHKRLDMQMKFADAAAATFSLFILPIDRKMG